MLEPGVGGVEGYCTFSSLRVLAEFREGSTGIEVAILAVYRSEEQQ
jgi:hypothetical protein